MCGLCGFLDRTGAPAERVRAEAMSDRLVHRGPDGEGVHLDGPLAFGHRRLSIIDLSERASEPMTNADESLWLVFNGEIYNFRELRKDLETRHRFRSDGDGEVILHLYAERGEEAVAALDGMFAFALWDVRRRKLLLGRDRAGKKPLYYHDGPRLFAFASEVKGLLAHPDVPKDKGRGVAAALSHLRVRADAGHLLQPHQEPAPRTSDGRDGQGHGRAPAVLGRALHERRVERHGATATGSRRGRALPHAPAFGREAPTRG